MFPARRQKGALRREAAENRPVFGAEFDFFAGRERADWDGGNRRGLGGGQLRDCDAGGLTGTGGNGLRVAEIENLEIVATGVDPMAAQYPGAHSTHTCGLYLAQWPQWSEFRNIDIRGLNTGIAIPALPVATPAGLYADSNRWQNVTIPGNARVYGGGGIKQCAGQRGGHGGEFSGSGRNADGAGAGLSGTQQGWTVRNAVVLPVWNAVQPQLTVTAAGGAVTG
jgi:hypothetical protein